MRDWWLRHYWRWYMRPVFRVVAKWKRRYRPAGHPKSYWTYSRPGKQSGPWADRVFITDRWAAWKAVPIQGTENQEG